MAETKLIKLPQKEWFTLPELAERWGCKPADLIHMAVTDHLTLSVMTDFWYLDYSSNKHRQREVWQRDIFTIDATFAAAFEEYGAASVYSARFAESEEFKKVAVVCPEFSRHHPGGHSAPEAPPRVSIQDLIVTRAEVERFEQAQNATEPPAVKPPADWIALAQKMGKELRLSGEKKQPAAVIIAARLKEDGVLGGRGNQITIESVMRWGLEGWSSWPKS